ncbi:MAG TPA: tetratricopeptide repeat protein, partial [Gammaproteobacteria bacterium]|nr:tetratricopeptide repeat protein [Gammaproteobacteria bacterium]
MKKFFAFFLLFETLFPALCSAQNPKIDSLYNKLQTAKEDTNKVKVILGLRDIYFFYNMDTSLLYNKEALDLSKKFNYKPGIITSYLYLSGMYDQKGNYKNALIYLNNVASLIEKNNSAGFAYLYNNLVDYYERQSDFSKAMDYSNKALQKANEANDSVAIVQSMESRAGIYREIGDYQIAISYYQQIIKMSERRHDILQVAANCYNIAEIYNLAHDYNKSIDYYNRSYSIAKKVNSNLLLAGDLAEIGNIYVNQNQLRKAVHCFQQALNANYALHDSAAANANLRDISMAYNKQGLSNEAIQSATDALQIANKLNYKPQISYSYECLGEIYITQKNYSKAIADLQKALTIAIAIDDENTQSSLYNDLAISCGALNDYKSTSIYLSKENAIKDSILSEENAKKTIEMGAVYSSEKNEKEIALLTKDKQIQTLQIKKQAFLQKSLIVGIILMGILFFFIYRSYHIRQLLKLQTLRNKIASDLHDDIGSTLSSISIFTLVAREGSKEVIPMLDKIGEYSRNMLESMSDIVWSINPDNDNFEKIILRMRSFAFELLRTKNIDFEFDADESL